MIIRNRILLALTVSLAWLINTQFVCGADFPRGTYTGKQLKEAKEKAQDKKLAIATILYAPDGWAPSKASSLEAMKKLKSKYVVLILNSPSVNKGEHMTVLPLLGQEVKKIMERDKRFAFPAVFMMNTSADKILYHSKGGWREPSKRLREIRNALKDIDITSSEGKSTKDSDEGDIKRNDPQIWTNKDGKTITATVIRIEDKKAVFKLSSGKLVEYPMEKLSDESRQKIEKLFADWRFSGKYFNLTT